MKIAEKANSKHYPSVRANTLGKYMSTQKRNKKLKQKKGKERSKISFLHIFSIDKRFSFGIHP